MAKSTEREGGFTLIEIMIVVSVIALLAALAIPNMIKARRRSSDSVCINNMKQIASGIEQVTCEGNLNLTSAGVIAWNQPPAPSTFGIIGAMSYIRVAPSCPNAGTYVAWGSPFGDVRMNIVAAQIMIPSLFIMTPAIPTLLCSNFFLFGSIETRG